jgi:hypothetical protein
MHGLLGKHMLKKLIPSKVSLLGKITIEDAHVVFVVHKVGQMVNKSPFSLL